MKYALLADRLIKPTMGIKTVMFKDGNTEDIVKVVLLGDRLSKTFTKDLAPELKGRSKKETLENVYWFIKDNIQYLIDEPGDEVIKSPGATPGLFCFC